jgi:crotonobetainyl-CoA:carnitine CoA-transferase CaiB-like acyl-CoA transferase
MAKGVLDGVRVLDFGRYIAAPFCSALLSDLGADVVRVEQEGNNDDRYLMPVTQTGEGAVHLHVNRNKRSVAVNIASEQGREIVRRLIRTSDVIVANLTPKSLLKIGLDYATISSINPGIILTTITAYGTKGAFRDEVGFDGIGQALSGGVFLTGTEGQPYRSAVSYVDYATGLSAAFGTLGAILVRNKTGRGQHVEASLLNTALATTNAMLIEAATGARSRKPIGNRSAVAGPSDIFATRDGWVLVQVVGEEMFGRWAELVGVPQLKDDPRFADDISRGSNGELLSEVAANWCKDRASDECISKLRAARIPSCRVLSPAEALQSPEIKNGGFFSWHLRDDVPMAIPVVRAAVDLSDMPDSDPVPAPKLGADTQQILLSVGFSDADIRALREQGVIRCNESQHSATAPTDS